MTDTEVERWMLFDSLIPSGGFGSTPFGTYFGAGSGGTWGLFTGDFRSAQLEVTCESCSRVRSQKRLGGITVFGGFISDGFFYVVASDVLIPATCYSLRITGPGGTFDIPLEYATGTPPPIYAPAPPTTALVPPPGAVLVDTMLRARLPEIPVTGSYTVTVVDRCCGCETPVATVTLEAPAMLLSPLDADIGGAPRRWLNGSRLVVDAGQAPGSGRISIPFDKCTVVVEYDARDAVLPDAQGWTRTGTGPAGDWSLSDGGALRLASTAPNTNYYEKAITTVSPPTQVYAYASVLAESIPAGAVSDGFDVRAFFAANAAPYEGVRALIRQNQIWYTSLDGTLETQLSFVEIPKEWMHVAMGDQSGGEEVGYERSSVMDGTLRMAPTIFGIVGVAPANELRCRFGNTNGVLSVIAHLRDFAAADGRFIRARFTAFAPVSSPVVRLYVAADANGSAQKTVRFKIKYGPGSGAPSGPLPMEVSATINMLVPNTVYEVPVSLPGLIANTPIWFTVERDWTHGDDKLAATAHLLQLTVRSS